MKSETPNLPVNETPNLPVNTASSDGASAAENLPAKTSKSKRKNPSLVKPELEE
jgi:hypothetical protein